MKSGYYGLSLHGGKDQADRDQTIADFKNGLRTILVATSVAGRGLDVKDLRLVINYDCPNHLEAYVHQVGRTGRAGNKGTSYTFITPEEDLYAGDIVKALRKSGKPVPEPLQKMVDAFKLKVKSGKATKKVNGYKTRGYKFDENEAKEADQLKKMIKKQFEMEAGIEVEDDEDKEMYLEELKRVDEEAKKEREEIEEDSDFDEAKVAAGGVLKKEEEEENDQLNNMVIDPHDEKQMLFVKLSYCAIKSGAGEEAVDKALNVLKEIQKRIDEKTGSAQSHNVFEEELIINDYPQQARFKAVQTDTRDHIMELTGCSIVCKGSYIPPNRRTKIGEKKLYLLITGDSKYACSRARTEMKRILDDATMDIGYDPAIYAAL